MCGFLQNKHGLVSFSLNSENIPDVDIKRLKRLSFGCLFDVARTFPPEKDPSPRLCLDVTQVRSSRTLHLFIHVERGTRLVQTHKNLCVHKTLMMWGNMG